MISKNRSMILVVVAVVVCAAGGLMIYVMQREPDSTVISTTQPDAAIAPTPENVPGVVKKQAAAPVNDAIAKALASADEATRQGGLAQLHDLADHDPHALGLSLPGCGPALLAGGYYDDADALAKTVIMRRAMDITTVQAAERLRVQGMLEHGLAETAKDAKTYDWTPALNEAKSYYNVAALSATADATNLLAQILARARGNATATEFLEQQAAADVSGPASQPSDILKSIQPDKAQWDFDLQYLQSHVSEKGPSYSSLMCQGEYYLIDDQPDDARKCFEGACKIATHKSKPVRDAVEAIARAIRARDGNVAGANAFIESLRKNPADAGAGLFDEGPDSPLPSEIKAAAASVKPAKMSKLDKAPASPK